MQSRFLSLTFTLVYRKRMMNGSEEELRGFAEFIERVLEEVDANLIVDIFPILDYLPRYLAPWTVWHLI